MYGFLYVMANQGMPGLYKIGYTTRSLKEREHELNNHEGVPYPFYTRFAVHLKNPSLAEKAAHMMHEALRVYTNKEFFRFDDEEQFGYFLDNLVSICLAIHNGFDETDAIATAEANGISNCSYDEERFKALYPDAIVLNEFESDLEVPRIFGEYPNKYNLLRKYLEQ